jgi:hypothetical protein
MCHYIKQQSKPNDMSKEHPCVPQDRHRQQIIDWINAAEGTGTAFDVTTKGIMHAVFEACTTSYPCMPLRASNCTQPPL